MKQKAKFIDTPLGRAPAPMYPLFGNELAKCKSNEDLFSLVEKPSNWRFANPDAWAEVEARGLTSEYRSWRDAQD